jgi:hypothetical protein
VLGRHVKQNGIRLPEHKTVVFERRHFLVGIESEVLRCKLIATSEIKQLYLTVKRKVIFQSQDAYRTSRRKKVEFHFRQTSLNSSCEAAPLNRHPWHPPAFGG